MIRTPSGQSKNPLLQDLENCFNPILHSDPKLGELQTDCQTVERLRRERRKLLREIKKLREKWKDADPNRYFQDPGMAEAWRSGLDVMRRDESGAYRQDGQAGKKKCRNAHDRSTAEEEASKLKEISEACERLGKLSNDMLKLYGGRDGIQRLRMLIKDAPQRQVKSVEEQLMETKIRQLAVLWREYKGIQARFADPAYDGPFNDPELEKARKARLRMLREPHENQAVYDALEAHAGDPKPRSEGDDA